MRTTRMLLGGLLALSLAACTGGTSPSPSEDPSVAPSVAPSTEPSPMASQAAEPLALSVAFDGETCTYTGPWVVPDGTLAEFSYTADAPTEPSILVVMAALPGATWEQILRDAETRPGSEMPDYISQLAFVSVESGDSALFTIRSALREQQFAGYLVGCATAPADEGGSDRMFPAAFIEAGSA
ncbi:MAG TPA: hypothetical protein VLA23_11990 [Candidatus Limnocylindrales bacterium]|nr:hypothetical protein [Candidatus Limnocylindrales bacterium]